MLANDLHKAVQNQINFLSTEKRQPNYLGLLESFKEVSKHQLTSNTALINYLTALEKSDVFNASENLTKINDLPSIPTDAFKHSSPPTTLAAEEITRTFLTSGTTTDIRGSHHFATTSTYETSIIAGWKYCNLPELHHTFFLTPSGTEAPHSSLSHMMQTLKSKSSPSAEFLLQNGAIDHLPIIGCAKEGKPVTIIGTALAFLQLFDILDNLDNIQLPEGSWALETGGYKGSTKSLTKEELYEKFLTYLSISPEHVWNEYSMTELSSQFYTNGLNEPHIGPPWAPIKVINPETNLPVQAGELGYLVIYDLANIDSSIGIRTQDLAIYHGPHSFTLIGRDPSALPRGCSRSL